MWDTKASLVLVLGFFSRSLCQQCVLITDLRPLPWEQTSDAGIFFAENVMEPYWTELSSSPSDDGVCNTCWNGIDAGKNISQNECNCTLSSNSTQSYFWGKCCQYVNISVPDIQATKRTVSILWDADRVITEKPYAFVFWEYNSAQIPTKRKPTICTERKALLAELKSGETNYTVCVLPQDLADKISNRSELEGRADCVSVVTLETETETERIAFVVVLTLMCVLVGGLFLLKLFIPIFTYVRENKVVNSLTPRGSI